MAFSNAGKYRLLAVDDDQDSAELIVRKALRSGYQSFPADDAKTLRESVPHWRPNIITLDLCLRAHQRTAGMVSQTSRPVRVDQRPARDSPPAQADRSR
jgi:CheY-like chemotaxis protein